MEYKLNTTPLSWNSRVTFECQKCGACCKHVQNSVPVESLDLYRIARLLRQHDKEIRCMDDVIFRYLEPIPLDNCGYFIYTLKTTGPDDACIFLKDNCCMIQDAKPRACRIYPFLAEPDGRGSFRYHLSMEKPHHFCGHKFKARNWMNRYFTQEDRAFVNADIKSTLELVHLMRRIPEAAMESALFHFIHYRYEWYSLNKPFLEQFLRNHNMLLEELEKLIQHPAK